MSRSSIRLAAACLAIWLASCQSPEPDAATPTHEQLIENRGEGKDNWWDALPRAAWAGFDAIDQSQSWFEVYEVEPGVFAIYEPGQFEEIISYLILGSENALLFDTGLGIGDIRAVVDQLTALPITVVNSHTHYDHVGGNHQFDDVRGTETDYTRNNSAGRAHDAVAEFVGDGWIWKDTPEGFSKDAYVSKPFTVTGPVRDGDVLDLGGRSLEILLTPGHAPDSLCLLDRDNGLLFTGDTLYPATLYAHLEGSDFREYTKTAARLATLATEVSTVLPAHNEPRISADYLTRMRDAFDAIANGEAESVPSDGAQEYSFDGFTILAPDPLPEP